MEINIFVKKLKLRSLSYGYVSHIKDFKNVYQSLRENNNVAEITRKFNFSEISGIEIHLSEYGIIYKNTKYIRKD